MVFRLIEKNVYLRCVVELQLMGGILGMHIFILSIRELSNNQNNPIMKTVNSISRSYTFKVVNIPTMQSYWPVRASQASVCFNLVLTQILSFTSPLLLYWNCICILLLSLLIFDYPLLNSSLALSHLHYLLQTASKKMSDLVVSPSANIQLTWSGFCSGREIPDEIILLSDGILHKTSCTG